MGMGQSVAFQRMTEPLGVLHEPRIEDSETAWLRMQFVLQRSTRVHFTVSLCKTTLQVTT